MTDLDTVESAAARNDGAAGASVGSRLRTLREQRGWSQEDVSAHIKFAVRQVRALEDERWEDLPQGMSLRGFVRNYARLLDIDPEPLLASISNRLQSPDPVSLAQASSLSSPIARSSGRGWPPAGRRRPASWLIAGFMVILAVALLSFALVKQGKLPFGSGSALDSPVAAGTAAAPAVVPASDGTAAPAAGAARSGAASAGAAAMAGAGALSGATPAGSAPGATAGAMPPGASAGAMSPAASAMPASPVPGPAVPGAASQAAPGSAAQATPPGATAQATPAGSATQALPGTAAASGAAAPAGQGQPGLALQTTEPSWIEVRRADGTVALSQTLEADARYDIDASAAPLRVVIGNAKGVRLSWRGKPVELSSRDNVVRLTLQ
ncbi:hypothetical protein GCM10023144_28950 [Pigmentiphaga soli]|uniref:Cytoskeleton protein RodZ-like C-terminal domain-containing protein n=1 Tax=Pigmentiphaga soli TaxID=1007095 RepID=A0ABP8H7P7_9BURK